MYTPKYTISNQILKNIGLIEAAKEVVENAPLVPAYERKFQEDALVRTVHHGTHIEGNDLSFAQAERLIQNAQGVTSAEKAAEASQVVARDRDIQEIINYRAVMEYVDQLFEKYPPSPSPSDGQAIGTLVYREETVKDIHEMTVYRIVSEELRGEYRKTQVVLKDSRTGEVTFRPPPAVEVPYLMEDLILFMNSKEGREIHPVLRAGVAHYVLAAIHPFVEGNGRTARAFATIVLFTEGYDIKRLFSLEEYFDRDAMSYYYTLIATSNQSKDLGERDLTSWLEYFTQGLAIELGKVREKVRKLSFDSRIKVKRGQQIALTDRQIKIVEYLSENNQGKMGELRDLFPMVSEDTVLRELQALVGGGVIRKIGHTKGARYILVT